MNSLSHPLSLFLSQVDTYGTQQPIALLKLFLEKGGMYDRGKDLNWKSFKEIGFVAAMGKVSKRNKDQYFVILVTYSGLVLVFYSKNS